jgi:hypothetical protein
VAPGICIGDVSPSLETMTDVDMARRNKKPRLLLESERARLEEFIDSIGYSARYATHHLMMFAD